MLRDLWTKIESISNIIIIANINHSMKYPCFVVGSHQNVKSSTAILFLYFARCMIRYYLLPVITTFEEYKTSIILVWANNWYDYVCINRLFITIRIFVYVYIYIVYDFYFRKQYRRGSIVDNWILVLVRVYYKINNLSWFSLQNRFIYLNK